jgi:hypothetical protein
MSKKQKEELSQTEQVNLMIKKVKSVFLDAIVREWLNTPLKDYRGLTPIQIIKKGDGKELLDAIKKSDEECKEERSKNDGN